MMQKKYFDEIHVPVHVAIFAYHVVFIIEMFLLPGFSVTAPIRQSTIWAFARIFISRGTEGPGREILKRPPSVCPSVCLSVRPSVTFSFRTVTQKRIDWFSRQICRYVHQVMGVCCIVFDIDGMLFEFFMNFWNIEKNKILRIKCPFTYWLNGRWFLQIVDGDSWNLYPLYPLFPCSDFVSQMWGWFVLTFYAISNISRKKFWEIQTNYFSFNVFFVFFLYAENIEKCPFTYSYWLNGRWFLQIVDIGHFILILYLKCGVVWGGGV